MHVCIHTHIHTHGVCILQKWWVPYIVLEFIGMFLSGKLRSLWVVTTDNVWLRSAENALYHSFGELLKWTKVFRFGSTLQVTGTITHTCPRSLIVIDRNWSCLTGSFQDPQWGLSFIYRRTKLLWWFCVEECTCEQIILEEAWHKSLVQNKRADNGNYVNHNKITFRCSAFWHSPKTYRNDGGPHQIFCYFFLNILFYF